ncbi:hypothetical protein D9599_18275 [Roseomonas sp. KE2513]|uniref:hypothetical protein n=1 Tax=Roseomonas sp. KE2513 TaxID=2479202 RepID=UPI0018DF661B|nr:hypothetical protein [Roseomonas sp. KE2513]MBI0537509.1 hypothetical protein [Roseomonas sp. KE2513]
MIPLRPLLPLAALALSACVAVPPAPQPPAAPLVAYPGAGKTAEALQVDDAACQAQPGGTLLGIAATTPATPPGNAAGAPAGFGTSPPAAPVLPAEAYLQCMAARGNVVAPAYAPPAFSYAPVYPSYFYGAYAWDYPWGYLYPFSGYGYHRFSGRYRGFYGRPVPPHGGFRGTPFGGGRGGFSHRGRH